MYSVKFRFLPVFFATYFALLSSAAGENSLSLTTLLMPHTFGVNNGRAVATKEFPAVVGVRLVESGPDFEFPPKQHTEGSGVVFYGSCIVTNKHVIEGMKDEIKAPHAYHIEVYDDPNRASSPYSKAAIRSAVSHPDLDLAVVKLDKPFPLENTFSLNDILPEEALDARSPIEIVGYGANKEQRTKDSDDLGFGNKRRGTNFFSKSVIVKGEKKEKFFVLDSQNSEKPENALMGDSGGLMAFSQPDGQFRPIAVISRGAKKLSWGTPLYPSKVWLQEQFRKAGCLSNEMESRIYRNDFLMRLYATTLQRSPDQIGYENWEKALATGVSEQNVKNAFANSAESKLAYINRIFHRYLGRSASLQEREGWVTRSNQVGWKEVEQAISDSAEAQSARTTLKRDHFK